MAAIRDASEEDWELLRAIRLLALRNAPLAFASNYDREADRDEQWWRGWLRSELWLLAFQDSVAAQPVGVIAATRVPLALVGEPFISSLWVDPRHRRHRIASRLVQAAADRVAARGADAVSLWVLDGNNAAIQLYEAMGFTRTGECQPAPGPADLLEWRMRKRLR
jgi:ribosomal protein S18 acetylase RimI-like enzyme